MVSSARFVEMTASAEAQDGKGYASFAEGVVPISHISSAMVYGHWVYVALFFSAEMYLEDMLLYDEMLIPKGLRLGKQRVGSRESRFVVNAAESRVEAIENPHLEGARGSTSLLLVSITQMSGYLGFAYNWYYEGGFRVASGLGHPLLAIPALLL